MAFLSTFKALGLDYFIVVKLCPYIAHSFLVMISDRYLWAIGKRTVGKHATRIALVFYLTNRYYNEMFIRCFTNTIETIFIIVAFYYYLNVKNRFDKNTVILTALVSLATLMRNTSIVGWIPLLIHKVIFDGSLIPFILGIIFVLIPTIGVGIFFDSLYFGELTITSLNFVKVNIVEGLSKYFGTDPPTHYLLVLMPAIFTVAYPGVLYSFYVYFKDTK